MIALPGPRIRRQIPGAPPHLAARRTEARASSPTAVGGSNQGPHSRPWPVRRDSSLQEFRRTGLVERAPPLRRQGMLNEAGRAGQRGDPGLQSLVDRSAGAGEPQVPGRGRDVLAPQPTDRAAVSFLFLYSAMNDRNLPLPQAPVRAEPAATQISGRRVRTMLQAAQLRSGPCRSGPSPRRRRDRSRRGAWSEGSRPASRRLPRPPTVPFRGPGSTNEGRSWGGGRSHPRWPPGPASACSASPRRSRLS